MSRNDFSLIQRVVRFLYIKDGSLPNDEEPNSYSIDNHPQGRPCFTSLNQGVTRATFSDRFMQISFKDFASVMLLKDVSSVTDEDLLKLSQSNTGRSLAQKKDAKGFRENFFRIQDQFIFNYYKQKENGQNCSVIDAIEEERQHNLLLKDTPTSIILNALTVYYRICSCYLTYCRGKAGYVSDDDDFQVTKTLLNVYFIRRLIQAKNYPYIEAAYHYHEDPESVAKNYGRITGRLSERFKNINDELNKVVSDEERDELMNMITKTMLYYRYVYTFTKKNKSFDFNLFSDSLSNYDKRNDDLIQVVFTIIGKNKDVYNELRDFLKREQEHRVTNTQLDKEFRSSLVYLSTETCKDFIPINVKRFVIRRLFVTKNKRALFRMFLSKKELSDIPSLRCFGVNDEFFNIDGAMKIFKGQDFIIAQSSFEPTLAGDDGYHDIASSKYCKTMLIQGLLLKIVGELNSYADENPASLSNCPDELKDRFSMCYESRPILLSKKNEINCLLDVFIKQVDEFLKVCSKDLFGIHAAKCFETIVNRLHEIVEEKSEDVKRVFYAFCDINYTHGY